MGAVVAMDFAHVEVGYFDGLRMTPRHGLFCFLIPLSEGATWCVRV